MRLKALLAGAIAIATVAGVRPTDANPTPPAEPALVTTIVTPPSSLGGPLITARLTGSLIEAGATGATWNSTGVFVRSLDLDGNVRWEFIDRPDSTPNRFEGLGLESYQVAWVAYQDGQDRSVLTGLASGQPISTRIFSLLNPFTYEGPAGPTAIGFGNPGGWSSRADAAFSPAVIGNTTEGLVVANQGGYDPYVRMQWSTGDPERELHQITHEFGTPLDDRFLGASDVPWGTNETFPTTMLAAGYTEGDLAGSTGGEDALVRAYGIALTVDWTDQFGTPANDRAVDADRTRNTGFVVGYTAGDLAGVNAGAHDVFVRAYDLFTESVLWTRQFGTTADDRPRAVEITRDGTILVLLETRGELAGASEGGADGALRAYDPDGNELWTVQFGEQGDDEVFGLAAFSDGSVVVNGRTETNPSGTTTLWAFASPATELPAAPTDLEVLPRPSALKASWGNPLFGYTTSYTATAAPGGGSCTTFHNSCTIADLDPNTSYTVTVVASNAAGVSETLAGGARSAIDCGGDLTHPFSDVPVSSFATADVACIAELGITTGTSPTTYNPSGFVNREQMGAFLARTYRSLTPEPCVPDTNPFTDVASTSFAATDIACIAELGITTGASPTTYDPTGLVTREQMAAFLARTYRLISGEPCAPDTAPFTDVAATSFAATDIACIAELGITTGTSPTTYNPTGLVTREQMAAFLARTYRSLTT